MLISNQTARAMEEVETRERDVLRAYTPGAFPETPDVERSPVPVYTVDPLSVTAPQDAFFVTADGARSLYTRDGRFAFKDGALVDSSGRAVLGFANQHAPLAPLRADPVDAALGCTDTAAVQDDGSVTYERRTIDPRTGMAELARVAVGRVALARFSAATKLQAVDGRHFAAPAQVAPHIGRARDGNFAAVRPFSHDSSAVDIDLGLERLQEAYMALDAMRAAGIAQYGAQKTAMDLLK